MKKKNPKHAEKNRPAGPNGVHAKPASAKDAAEAKRNNRAGTWPPPPEGRRLVLFGQLDMERCGKIYSMFYAVCFDAALIKCIERLGRALKNDPPSIMCRVNPGPTVCGARPRNRSPRGFALDLFGLPDDTPAVHVNRDGLDFGNIPVIDEPPVKTTMPGSNAYLLVNSDGSFGWRFEVGNIGTFFTEYCTVKEAREWMHGAGGAMPTRRAG